MKSKLFKNSIKEIKGTFKRFVSILLMSFLGVGFFTGLVATGPDMQEAIDSYYDETNTYDIAVVSTMGLKDDDKTALQNIEGVESVYEVNSKDQEIKTEDKDYIAKFIELKKEVNNIHLKEGNLPQNENECVLDNIFAKMREITIGNKIQQGDKEYTVVGLAESPLYVSSTRGTTTLGAGSINCYIYVNQIEQDYYTNLYIKVNNAQKLKTNSKEYNELIGTVKQRVENIKTEREEARYNEIRDEAQSKVNDSKNELETQKKDAEKQISDAENKISNAESQIKKAKNTLENSKAELEKKKTETNKQLEQAQQQIDLLKVQMPTATAQIAAAEKQLSDNKAKAEESFKQAQQQINSAEKEIKNNESKVSTSKKEIEDKKEELNSKISEAEEEISKAEKEIEEIEKAKWYITIRTDNSGYSTFIDSVQSMINVAKLFPIVFYVIAILTSLTSMTRMVEEERVEIGTLKALGYTNKQILGKYTLYSSLATIIGGIIGMSVGFKFLPTVIWTIYKILFNISNFSAPFRIDTAIIGLGIAIVCIVGATIFVCVKELKNMPAVLMRPKAPKSGKRIALERIKIIWKHLSFSKKVTARNLFRYKKRAIMTIVGIAGCTSLIVAGFGLKDSITGIVAKQYGEIYNYQDLITIKDTEVIDKIDTNVIETNMKTGNYKGKDINILTAKENIEEVINLIEKDSNKKIQLEEQGISITEKLASTTKTKVGDTITFTDSDDKEYTFKVNHILKNYVYNYIYMSKASYESTIGTYETNTLLIRNELNEEQKEKILQDENVTSLVETNTMVSRVDDMLKSLNYVVLILIVAAALLAFVVLYNLSNINIGERIREIATLKVLGFYDKEVDNYISKETWILTLIGIFIGLFGGYILCNFLITTCEVDLVRFIKHITIQSYCYSIIITIAFSFIVNIIVHNTLKKIDMIESLKSVE